MNRTIRSRANGRLLDAADLLRSIADRMDAQAVSIDQAVSHIAYELVVLGFPSSSGGGERVTGSSGYVMVRDDVTGDMVAVPITGTERSADLSWQLTSCREDMRDAITALVDWAELGVQHANVLTLATNNARKIRVSKRERDEAETERRKLSMTVCADMLHGKDGAHEWSDPLCSKPSVKAGLCTQHYYAWYRWRNANGVNTSKDHEPAA